MTRMKTIANCHADAVRSQHRGLFADRCPPRGAERLIDQAWKHLDYLQHCDPADLRANRRGLIELREMLERVMPASPKQGD